MKTKQIIGILVIAVAISLIITTTGDASNYLSFSEAQNLANQGSKTQFHVVGKLKKDVAGNIIGVQSSPDMLSFRFVMVDEDGTEQLVYHPNPMPTDFKKSEQVVIIGSYENENFIADKILLKCPSKYQEDTIEI